MDMWNETDTQIKHAAKKYFGKHPTEVLRQSGLWAYVFFADGTSETIYQWMLDYWN